MHEVKKPLQSWDIYFLFSDFYKTRSDIEGFNSNTFSNDVNRVTMAKYDLYSAETNKIIGVLSSQRAEMQMNAIYTNMVLNNHYNIFDELIAPNHTTGFIIKNGTTDGNLTVETIFPPRSITQDMYGRKIVVLKLPDAEFVNVNEFKSNWRIELYDEDF